MARKKLSKEEKEMQINEDLQALKEIYLHGTKADKHTLSELLKMYKHQKEKEKKRKEIQKIEEELKKEKDNFKKLFGVDY